MANCERTIEFVEVDGTSEHFPLVKRHFEQVLEPLYGSQDCDLNKIGSSTGRKCLLMFSNQEPVGILVFKTEITDDRKDSKYTSAGCLVIKTFFVINSSENSGKGYGSRLMDQAIEEARERHATSIYVTVSEQAPEALEFFQNKGFEIEKGIKGKYNKPGVTEYVLTKALK